MIHIVFCPGGNSVYYSFGIEALGLALLVMALCTGSIIFFWSNLKMFITKKPYSKKWLYASFVWVLSMAVFNVITFMFFIKPTKQQLSGTASNYVLDHLSLVLVLVSIVIISLLIFYFCCSEKKERRLE